METISIRLNGTDARAPAGSTILEAARLNHIDIPTLCYLRDKNCIGACRVCVVEVKGARGPVPSCVTMISPGMEILTDSPEVTEARHRTLDLICANHRMDCEYCSRYSDCELHALCRRYGIDERDYNPYAMAPELDESAAHLVRDASKCLQCRRCIAACREQHMDIIAVLGRGYRTHIAPPQPLASTSCIGCGQCIAACPTGALTECDDTQKVFNAINRGRHVIAAVTPYVAAELGELFEERIGTNVQGKAIAALRRMGFAKVFAAGVAGTAIAAAEKAELAERFKAGKRLPLLTARCPAWVTFCTGNYPEFAVHLSGLRSAPETFGALCRSAYAREAAVDMQDIFVVYIDSCTAGKRERQNEGSCVDVSLTTREFAALFKRACVSRFTALKVWRELPDEAFDAFPDLASIGSFYAGGAEVMESEFELDGRKVKAAVVSGLAGAVRLLQEVKSGKKRYDFIEVMACPGGCLNGGGQPRQFGQTISFACLYSERAKALQSTSTPEGAV
jgi:NADH dehydrogenase/NADH:ubiquinone oxidoreductase subunit G